MFWNMLNIDICPFFYLNVSLSHTSYLFSSSYILEWKNSLKNTTDYSWDMYILGQITFLEISILTNKSPKDGNTWYMNTTSFLQKSFLNKLCTVLSKCKKVRKLIDSFYICSVTTNMQAEIKYSDVTILNLKTLLLVSYIQKCDPI